MTTHSKEVIQYSSAIWMLMLGSGLTIASFIVTGGQIHETVLWLFAQCLIYAGSIFGVYIYINNRFRRLENKVDSKLQSVCIAQPSKEEENVSD